jgi:Na+-driven multidrug efflux pump
MFNNDPALLEIAPRIFRMFFAGLSIMGIQTACQNTFLALKQSVISLILALLRKVILLIPLSLILSRFLGIDGVFYAEPSADLIAIFTTFTVFTIAFEKILRKKEKELALKKNPNPIS